MKRAVVVINIVLLVGFLLLTSAAAIRKHGAINPLSLVTLLPFGMTVIALKSPLRPAATWTAIGLNVLLVIAGLVIVIAGTAFPVWGVAIAVLLCVVPGVLNVVVLFLDSRRRGNGGAAT
jgi:hypothetical protein